MYLRKDWFVIALMSVSVAIGPRETIAYNPTGSTKVDVRAVDISKKEEVVTFATTTLKRPTLVVAVLLFCDAVSQHESWGDKDRQTLKDTIRQLRVVHDAMPTTDDLVAYRHDNAERLEALHQERGITEGRRLFTIERDAALLAKGGFVTVHHQQEAVWKVVESLDGKLSRYQEF